MGMRLNIIKHRASGLIKPAHYHGFLLLLISFDGTRFLFRLFSKLLEFNRKMIFGSRLHLQLLLPHIFTHTQTVDPIYESALLPNDEWSGYDVFQDEMTSPLARSCTNVVVVLIGQHSGLYSLPTAIPSDEFDLMVWYGMVF